MIYPGHADITLTVPQPGGWPDDREVPPTAPIRRRRTTQAKALAYFSEATFGKRRLEPTRRLRPERTKRNHQLEVLGYRVTLEPAA